MRQVKIDEQLFYDICKYIFTGNKDTEEQNIKLEKSGSNYTLKLIRYVQENVIKTICLLRKI